MELELWKVSGRCLDRCLPRRDAVAAGEEHSADEQKSRVNIASSICTEGRCLQQRDAVAAGDEHTYLSRRADYAFLR